MRPVVYHADDGKEEGSHDAVADHLDTGSGEADRVHGGKAHGNEAHVADAGVTDEVLEVGLTHGDEGTVDDVDDGEEDDEG